jgi:hypothetical protein
MPVVFPQVLPDWGKVLAGRVAEQGGGAPPASAAKGKAAPPAKTKESARAKAAKERAAAAAAEAAEDEEEELDEEEYDEADVLKSMGKGPFTAEDIRRQRRCAHARRGAAAARAPSPLWGNAGCARTPRPSAPAGRAATRRAQAGGASPPLATPGGGASAQTAVRRLTRARIDCFHRSMLSNRESARRSRRRKLEHVHTLQQQARPRSRHTRDGAASRAPRPHDSATRGCPTRRALPACAPARPRTRRTAACSTLSAWR